VLSISFFFVLGVDYRVFVPGVTDLIQTLYRSGEEKLKQFFKCAPYIFENMKTTLISYGGAAGQAHRPSVFQQLPPGGCDDRKCHRDTASSVKGMM
jgi:hypothetical protein